MPIRVDMWECKVCGEKSDNLLAVEKCEKVCSCEHKEVDYTYDDFVFYKKCLVCKTNVAEVDVDEFMQEFDECDVEARKDIFCFLYNYMDGKLREWGCRE